MTTSSDKLEDRKVQELAREYRRRGFEVQIEPSKHGLPASFGSYVPDLVAHRGDEHVVIEVKSRDTLSSSKQLATIAKSLEALPGWRLELVVTNPILGDERRPILDPYSAKRRLSEARKLFSRGMNEATILLGWSAAEATLRLKAEVEHITLNRPDPRYLIKLLFSRGLLSKNDYQLFDRVFAARSRIAHGFENPTLSRRTTESFLNAITRLIGSLE